VPLDDLLGQLTSACFGESFPLYGPQGEGDGPEAGLLRLANLRSYLTGRAEADIVLVGEAAGYRGMRHSGIAFTSERDLLAWGGPYCTTSLLPQGWAEPSATIVHRALGKLGAESRVILWNAVPAHPHRPEESCSNRPPSPAEIEEGHEHLERLLELVRPRLVVAVGRVAQSLLGAGAAYVRHPANGGAIAFRQGLDALLAG
jgi:hypothetical protein